MDTRDHWMTQEDGSIHTALAWLSASITALQKGDSEGEGRVGGGNPLLSEPSLSC